MSLSTKILVVLGALAFLILGGLFIYTEIQHKAQLAAINDQLTSQKQLADNITRSLATYATKDDMNSFAQASNVNLAAITKDLATLNSSLAAMNKITVDSSGEKQSNLPSTSVSPNPTATTTTGPTATCNGQQIPCPNADPNGYMKNVQSLHLNEDFADNTNVPIGDVSFDASNAKPWSVNIVPREYASVTTLGEDEDGKFTAYNNFSINANGQNYPIKVTNAQLVQTTPTAHFSFKPRLFLGMDGGVNITNVQPELTPNVSVGVIGYGTLRSQPDLSILQVGAGYGTVSKNFQITVAPISYNLGSKIPLMSNFYVGPTVSMDVKGNFTAGIGIRVGL